MGNTVLHPCKKCQLPASHVKTRKNILLGKYYLECGCHARLLYDTVEEAVEAWDKQNAPAVAVRS